MPDYDGVHVGSYSVRGVAYVRLWWYTGRGSQRKAESLGARSKLTKAQISRVRREKESQLAKQPGRIAADKAPTWESWSVAYRESRRDLAQGSAVLLEQMVRLFTAWLETQPCGPDVRMDRVTRSMATSYRTWLSTQPGKAAGSKMSGSTVAKHVRGCSMVFKSAVDQDLIPSNPFDRLPKSVRTDVKGHPDLDEKKIGRLLDAAPSTGWRCLLGLCTWSGIRRHEAMALDWQDVQWGQSRLVATTRKQSGSKPKRRDVLMLPQLEQLLLEAYEAGLPKPCDGVSANNIHRNAHAIIRRAGFEPWQDPFHALRRWRDSTWKAEYPGFYVDQWLGHGAEVSARHYLTVPASAYEPDGTTQELKQAIAAMDSVGRKLLLARAQEIMRNIGATEDNSRNTHTPQTLSDMGLNEYARRDSNPQLSVPKTDALSN